MTLEQLGIDPALAVRFDEVIARRNRLVHHVVEDAAALRAFTKEGVAELVARVDRLALDCQIVGNALAPQAFGGLERILGASLDELLEAVRVLDVDAVEDEHSREQLRLVQTMIEQGLHTT